MNQQAIPSALSLTTSPVWGLKTSTPEPAVLVGDQVDVRLAEDDEQVALAGVLQVARHVQVGVHARLEHRDAAELGELGGVGFVVECAGDQHVELGIARLAGGFDKVGALHGAELGADEDGGALLALALHIAAFGADQVTRPWRQRREGDSVLLVGLLHAGGVEVLQDHLGEGLPPVSGTVLAEAVDQFVVLVHAEHAVGTEALHRERASDTDLALVLIGPVVEISDAALAAIGASISFCRAMRASQYSLCSRVGSDGHGSAGRGGSISTV